MKILILGANGFIGHHLVSRIINTTSWHVYGLDLYSYNLTEFLSNDKFYFQIGDVKKEKKWIKEKITECDVVLPLTSIATPKSYVKTPLKVFESVFENNLWIIRQTVESNCRVIFPSTSEVYGMCNDDKFNEEKSHLVLGPIHKERWIYSCSKQLLDRILWAYKKENVNFTIFRPFNWIGPNLDKWSPDTSSRSVTQILGDIINYKHVKLIDGGNQKRSFTDIDDGINALMSIINCNEKKIYQRIFNIGNPDNETSIFGLSKLIINELSKYEKYKNITNEIKFISVPSHEYYGKGYQDIQKRVPDISLIKHHLNWSPKIKLEESIKKIVSNYKNIISINNVA